MNSSAWLKVLLGSDLAALRRFPVTSPDGSDAASGSETEPKLITF